MKKLIALLTVAACAVAFTATAAGKKALTDDQKALLEKYDTNKDGKLDKGERAAASAEDKEKIEKAFPAGKKKKDK
jgi:hypothetical protein